MLVIITERAPAGLRGELTRWLLEPKAGVFVGRVSAMVRERLWQRVCSGLKGGAAMMIWSTSSEQGFRIDFWGATRNWVTEWEGLQLITAPREEPVAGGTQAKPDVPAAEIAEGHQHAGEAEEFPGNS